MVRDNPNKVFLFGDNIQQKGFGGQAKEMRGEPNAIGVPTKWFPSRNIHAYFTDQDFALVACKYDIIFFSIQKSCKIVVIPEDGLGTGLARLDKTAPRIFEYLQQKLKELEDA